MLVIGGTSTVSGAVFGCFLVTFAFEGLRGIEAALNRAQVFTEQVVGLTEVALALAMIGILILRPGGLFATAEIGAPRPCAAPPARMPHAYSSTRPTRQAHELEDRPSLLLLPGAPEPEDIVLLPAATALLVIDIQNTYLEPKPDPADDARWQPFFERMRRP